MLRVFIIEDEAPALRRLGRLLADAQPPCAVAGTADSLTAAAKWLRDNPAPDVIFADIQLGDGLSLDLFRSAPPPAPVIFTTAHDAYLLDAFGAHGIAYLLKPVQPADLATALAKHAQLGRQYVTSFAALALSLSSGRALRPSGDPDPRRRILAQRGTAQVPVAIADIAYFFSADKLTFLMTRAGEKALVNEPLAALETDLAPAGFFRLNRNYLARPESIRSFASLGKGRLAIQLTPPTPDEVHVTQERAPAFKSWASR